MLHTSLDMSEIIRYADKHPKKYEEFLPKFNGTNAIMIEKYMDELYRCVGGRMIEEEYVVVMLFSLSLKGHGKD